MKIILKILSKNQFFNILGVGFPVALQVIIMPIIISNYGISNFGLYSIINSVIYTVPVIGFGTNVSLIKYVSENETDQDLYYYSLVNLFVIIWLIAMIFMLLPFKAHGVLAELLKYKYYLATAGFSNLIVIITQATFKGQNNYSLHSVVSIILALSNYGLPLILILIYEISLEQFFFVYSMSYPLALLIVFLTLKRFKIIFDWNAIKHIYSYSFKIGWANLLNISFVQGQKYLLLFFTSMSYVGIYSIAYTIFSKLHLVLSSYNETVLSELFNIKEKKIYIKDKIIRSIFASLFVYSLTYFCLEVIKKILLKNQIGAEEFDLIFYTLIIPYFVMGFSSICYHVFNTVGLQKVNLITLFIRVTSLFILVLILGNFRNIVPIIAVSILFGEVYSMIMFYVKRERISNYA